MTQPNWINDEPAPEPTGYRCYLLNATGHIAERHDLGVIDDTMAKSDAWAVLIASQYEAAELWHLARRICQMQRCDAGVAADPAVTLPDPSGPDAGGNPADTAQTICMA